MNEFLDMFGFLISLDFLVLQFDVSFLETVFTHFGYRFGFRFFVYESLDRNDFWGDGFDHEALDRNDIWGDDFDGIGPSPRWCRVRLHRLGLPATCGSLAFPGGQPGFSVESVSLVLSVICLGLAPVAMGTQGVLDNFVLASVGQNSRLEF